MAESLCQRPSDVTYGTVPSAPPAAGGLQNQKQQAFKAFLDSLDKGDRIYEACKQTESSVSASPTQSLLGQASLSGVRVIPCAFGVTLGGDDRCDRTSVARGQSGVSSDSVDNLVRGLRIAKAPAARWANEEGMQLAPDKEKAVVCGGEVLKDRVGAAPRTAGEAQDRDTLQVRTSIRRYAAICRRNFGLDATAMKKGGRGSRARRSSPFSLR
ncbi:hypothetical protein FOZ61_006502 [Perkinsus olseni]|uniref:Uncharacterized protein n=1 Tax=Perkinsus olseni TaxID=32597 RepID=A0A7J6LD93_PEROL|nr:hypothetical protein FOZ61_006502 [Perkinsus olseni]